MKRFFANAALMIVSLALTLVCVEFGLRIFAPQIIDCKINTAWRSEDPVLPYIPKANYRGRMEVPNQFNAVLTTNAQGFRGLKDVDIEQDPGVTRILFMGDSFTFGWGVDDDETYPYRVGELLAGGNPPGAIEVVNAAVYGFDIVEHLEWFTRIIEYSPDILVLGFTLENDLNINPLRDRVPFGPIRIESGKSLKYRIKEFVNRLHLVTLVRDRLYLNFPAIRNLMFLIGVNHKRDIFLKDYPTGLNESLERAEEILRHIQSVCDSKGTRLIVALIPLREQVYCRQEIDRFPGYDIERPNKALQEILTKCAIEHIDLLPEMVVASERMSGRLYFDIDPHWTPVGHEVAARFVADYLWHKKILKNKD